MFYEINVSKNGRHLFATHERSLKNKDEAETVLELFKIKFPEEEGYKVDMYLEESRRSKVS